MNIGDKVTISKLSKDEYVRRSLWVRHMPVIEGQKGIVVTLNGDTALVRLKNDGLWRILLDDITVDRLDLNKVFEL